MEKQLKELGFIQEQTRKIPDGLKEFDHEEYKTFQLVNSNVWRKDKIKITVWEDYNQAQVVSYEGETYCRNIKLDELINFLKT